MGQRAMGRNVRTTEKAFVNAESMRQWGVSERAIEIFTYSPSANMLALAILTGEVRKDAKAITGKDPIDTLQGMTYAQVRALYEQKGIGKGASRMFFPIYDHGFGIKLDFKEDFFGESYRQSYAEIEAWETIKDSERKWYAPILCGFVGRHGGKTTTDNHGNKKRCGRWILSAVPLAIVGDCTAEEIHKIENACKRTGIAAWDIRYDNIGRLKNGQAVLLDYGVK